MSDLILHHYEISPYSEKIRMIFGFKRLSWRSVVIPIVMPKPDLTALTGGYRRTPVLQIGADIYCDTKLIARKLEQLHPHPALIPEGAELAQTAMTRLSDSLFAIAVAIVFGVGHEAFDSTFLEDRQKLIPGGLDVDLMKAILPAKLDQMRAHLDLLDTQLRHGDGYLAGAQATLADVSVYHVIKFLRSTEATVPLLAPYDAIRTWGARIDEYGHGNRTEMDSAAAIEVARSSDSTTAPFVDPAEPAPRAPGDAIMVLPEDYGRDPVSGELVYADVHEIAVRRTDKRAGEVVVHFPREDFAVLPSS